MNRKHAAALLGFVIFVLLFSAPAGARAYGQVLDIPPRLQWDEKNGYCGECSVQQIALYYGGYLSQFKIREIFDPTQKRDLWIENNGPVIKALRLKSEQWNYNQAQPQYKKFLVWMKQHIHLGHPVIMGVFYWDPEEPEPTYDHIVPAIGVTSKDFSKYLPEDTLTFNDDYTFRHFTRRFSAMADTRSMEENGDRYEFCIPKLVDYGCAVIGIRDDDKVTRPVQVKVNRWDEPNPWQGKPPVTLQATVTVRSLVPGRSYILLRYNDYRKVPAKDFLTSAYAASWRLTATGKTASFNDSFKSNGVAIYRCVPAAK